MKVYKKIVQPPVPLKEQKGFAVNAPNRKVISVNIISSVSSIDAKTALVTMPCAPWEKTE